MIADNVAAGDINTLKGVLWDMDGVLVDTGEFHFQSWLAVLPEYGIAYDREAFERTFGMNNPGTLRALTGRDLPPEVVEEISRRKEETYRAALRGQAKALPGAKAWLARLKARGFRQGIASSTPQANIDVVVSELDIAGYLDVIVSGAEMAPKPDPQVFLTVAERLGVPPQRCVVVEDSRAGVEAARRGGMSCIAVTTTNPPEALQTADVIVDRLDELPDDVFERLLDRSQG